MGWEKKFREIFFKNRRKFKIQTNFENLILELPFGIGFIEIHKLARFLQHFEI